MLSFSSKWKPYGIPDRCFPSETHMLKFVERAVLFSWDCDYLAWKVSVFIWMCTVGFCFSLSSQTEKNTAVKSSESHQKLQICFFFRTDFALCSSFLLKLFLSDITILFVCLLVCFFVLFRIRLLLKAFLLCNTGVVKLTPAFTGHLLALTVFC